MKIKIGKEILQRLKKGNYLDNENAINVIHKRIEKDLESEVEDLEEENDKFLLEIETEELIGWRIVLE